MAQAGNCHRASGSARAGSLTAASPWPAGTAPTIVTSAARPATPCDGARFPPPCAHSACRAQNPQWYILSVSAPLSAGTGASRAQARPLAWPTCRTSPAGPGTAPRRRRAARVVLVDPAQAVLIAGRPRSVRPRRRRRSGSCPGAALTTVRAPKMPPGASCTRRPGPPWATSARASGSAGPTSCFTAGCSTSRRRSTSCAARTSPSGHRPHRGGGPLHHVLALVALGRPGRHRRDRLPRRPGPAGGPVGGRRACAPPRGDPLIAPGRAPGHHWEFNGGYGQA